MCNAITRSKRLRYFIIYTYSSYKIISEIANIFPELDKYELMNNNEKLFFKHCICIYNKLYTMQLSKYKVIGTYFI